MSNGVLVLAVGFGLTTFITLVTMPYEEMMILGILLGGLLTIVSALYIHE